MDHGELLFTNVSIFKESSCKLYANVSRYCYRPQTRFVAESYFKNRVSFCLQGVCLKGGLPGGLLQGVFRGVCLGEDLSPEGGWADPSETEKRAVCTLLE